MPVTDLFEEYRNDIRWVKTFYLPARFSSVDIFFTIEPDKEAKTLFQKEETRLFNLVNCSQAPETLPPQRVRELTKLDYCSFFEGLGADFMSLPERDHVFKERVSKFFSLVKTWTRTAHLNVDLGYLESFVENAQISGRVKSRLSKDFPIATNFPSAALDRIKILNNNLSHFGEKHNSAPRKVAFVTADQDLGNNTGILKSLLGFVIERGLRKFPKGHRAEMHSLLSKEFMENLIQRISQPWEKLRKFQWALNRGMFSPDIAGITDESEFSNLHRLLPLVYGPTSLNSKYFRKRLSFLLIKARL